mgnify:CR=1 FL=1
MTKQPVDNLRKEAVPSKEFERVLWSRLDAELESVHLHKRAWYQRFAMPVAALVIVGVLGGSGTYAYASPSVTPDTTLYPVKTSIEWIEEKFYRSPERLAGFHHRMAERREAELDRISRPEVEEVLRARMRHRIQLSEQQIEYIQDHPEARERLQDRARRFRARHVDWMEERMEREDEERGEVSDRHMELNTPVRMQNDRTDPFNDEPLRRTRDSR